MRHDYRILKKYCGTGSTSELTILGDSDHRRDDDCRRNGCEEESEDWKLNMVPFWVIIIILVMAHPSSSPNRIDIPNMSFAARAITTASTVHGQRASRMHAPCEDYCNHWSDLNYSTFIFLSASPSSDSPPLSRITTNAAFRRTELHFIGTTNPDISGTFRSAIPAMSIPR